jgi:hypothetical protein
MRLDTTTIDIKKNEKHAYLDQNSKGSGVTGGGMGKVNQLEARTKYVQYLERRACASQFHSTLIVDTFEQTQGRGGG